MDTTFAASTKGSLTRLTVNSFVEMMLARVSSGFFDVTGNEMLRRGGLCATCQNHEMDDYVTWCEDECCPPARNSYTQARLSARVVGQTGDAHLDRDRLGRPFVAIVESRAIGRGTTALVNNEYTRLKSIPHVREQG